MEDDTIAKSGDYDFGNLKYINKYDLTSIEYTFDKSPFVYKVYLSNFIYNYKDNINISVFFNKMNQK